MQCLLDSWMYGNAATDSALDGGYQVGMATALKRPAELLPLKWGYRCV